MFKYISCDERGGFNETQEHTFSGFQLTEVPNSTWWALSMRYGPIILLLALGVLLASWWFGSNAGESEIPDWRPLLAQAETARQNGDLYDADTLYSQAGRVASWQRDWVGLHAAACGMNRLYEGSSLGAIRGLLVSAMLAAQDQQSKEGLYAVARAFAAMGQDKLTNAVLSRIHEEWPDIESLAPDGIPQNCGWHAVRANYPER